MEKDLYKDMILKLKFYKEEVVKSFVKRGHFPMQSEITAALENLDYRTALFESYLSKQGSYFNTKEMNKMFELIYKDLEFLYTILQDILINDYNSLKLYIETHLSELEDKADMFEQRFEEEMNTSSLGTTIFFQSNNWSITTQDEYTIIDLGNIELIQGSKIALYANIENIEGNDTYFKFIASDDAYSFNALPYNYNNNIYTVPGEKKVNKSELVLNGQTIINDYMNITFKTNELNDYKILAGTNNMIITYKDTNQEVVHKFAFDNNMFYTDQECYIEFYYVDGSYLTYNFNKKPNHCNFSLNDSYIKSDSEIKKIFIDAPKGFACSFSMEDGQIWASCEEGIVNGPNDIIYSGNWDLRDFEIREYVKSEKTEYNLKLYIKSTNNVSNILKNVYIKEVD